MDIKPPHEEEIPNPLIQEPVATVDPAKKNAMMFAGILGIVTVIVVVVFIIASMGGDDSEEEQLNNQGSFPGSISESISTTTTGSSNFEPTNTPNQSTPPGIEPRPADNNDRIPVAPLVIPTESFQDPALIKLQEKYLSQLEKLIYGKTNTGEDLSKLEPFVSVSPYAGKITIRSVARSSSGNTKDEYIVLSTTKDVPENFHITGLILKSLATGQEIKIGDGVYLPYNNQINYKESIAVGPSNTVYIITGQSPVGYSFQVNKCSGYWNQFQSFKPNLRLNCPRIIFEQNPTIPPQFNDACFNYVNKLGACKIHVDGTNQASDPYYQLQPECRQFIDRTAGYNNCINLYKNDEDFYRNEWRVYLNRTSTLWKAKREIIQLLDDNRKVIAQYAY
jgi:hypothetical protein